MTAPVNPWPCRKVVFSFEHATAGDTYFQPLIAAAMTEYLGADPHGAMTQFDASNGVRITITPEHP